VSRRAFSRRRRRSSCPNPARSGCRSVRCSPFQYLAKLAHYRPVAFRDREFALKHRRIDDQRIISGEQDFQLGTGRFSSASQSIFLAVGQEDEGDAELIGTTPALRLAAAQVDAGAFGFDDRDRAALPIEQRVIGLAAVIEGVFKADAAAIRQPRL
jgi:hypothetical protein